MKHFSLIALLLFAFTFSSNANTSIEIATPYQSVTNVVDDNSTVTTSDNSSSEDASAKKKKKRKKNFKDRSIAGKILIIAGVAVFAVLCLLFGTVSIG
jgi:hypothetical protein